jgi:hypothetical protein
MAARKRREGKTEDAERIRVATIMARIRINADEMIMALDDHDDLVTWYLDRENGELLRVSEALLGDEDEELSARIEAGPDRYLYIEPLPSAFGYRLMEEFAGALDDPGVRAALERALDGRRPFRAFKDALLDYPPVRERWFRFKEERMLAEAHLLLEAEKIEFEWTGREQHA